MSDPAPKAPPSVAATRGTPGTSKVVVGLLLANLAVSGFLLATTMGKGSKTAAVAQAKPVELPDQITGRVVPLDPFVVNLNEPGTSRYLKVQLQLELRDGAATKVFEKSKQLVREDVIRYLSGLRVADALGTENKDKIREALEMAMLDRLGENRVLRVIITDFVVQ